MKHIFLNLKRFDIPPEFGGVNRLAPVPQWGGAIVGGIQPGLVPYAGKAEFAVFLPEAHLIPAAQTLAPQTLLQLGCQSVYRDDTAAGGNFGAFTSNRTANAMAAMGCGWTIIGHCEERRDKLEIIREGGGSDKTAVDRLLNRQIKCALNAGLKVLYCIGETAEEHDDWQAVLGDQLKYGLESVPADGICIAYEPVWAIGPGKTPPGREYIQEAAQFIKAQSGGLPVVYGGGLKQDNAAMLASIPEIDGGLIALTRFAGEIGFYPEEYLEIVKTYMEG